MDPTYPLYPIFAFISFILVLIPLPWHLQAWNSGTCLLIFWLAIGCLNQFVNAIVWHDYVKDVAPVWCDISTAIMVALNVAIPASTLCIMRRLYNIAARTVANVTVADKRKQVIIDLIIGLGIPLIQLPLHYIVQGHRYDIFEDIGCYPTTYNTVPAYPLVFVWPIVIGSISVIYSGLTLRAFFIRRAQFTILLSRHTHSSLTLSRYLRLMGLATSEIIFNFPLCAYSLYLNASRQDPRTGKSAIKPWKSWDNTHLGFNIIDSFPALFWRQSQRTVIVMEFGRWSLVVGVLVFFAFFGFAEEARKSYRAAWVKVLKVFGLERFITTNTPKKVPGQSMLKSFKLSNLPAKQDGDTLPVYMPSSASSTFPTTKASSSPRTSFTASVHTTDFTSIDSPPLPDYKPRAFSSDSNSTMPTAIVQELDIISIPVDIRDSQLPDTPSLVEAFPATPHTTTFSPRSASFSMPRTPTTPSTLVDPSTPSTLNLPDTPTTASSSGSFDVDLEVGRPRDSGAWSQRGRAL